MELVCASFPDVFPEFRAALQQRVTKTLTIHTPKLSKKSKKIFPSKFTTPPALSRLNSTTD